MGINIESASRIIGGAVLAAVFAILGSQLAQTLSYPPLWFMIGLGAVGGLLGLLFTPLVTVRPMSRVRHALSAMPLERLVALMIGVFLGLIAAALFSIPLSQLPSPFKEILPLLSALGFCYLGAVIMMGRYGDIRDGVSGLWPFSQRRKTAEQQLEEETGVPADSILLDTSVIIDGRILDISRTGFIRGTLLVPNFVLNELQYIADSPDSLRRQRGRRGLEILGLLQNESPIPILITDLDAPKVREVDGKLVALGLRLDSPILTNDYNLNRVADLQGIDVLNINDLANSVKAAFLPGEALNVKIIQEGKEYGQGVGYLEDGTMVVVEDGVELMNQTEDVTVTKVLQTAAGRMIFAKP